MSRSVILLCVASACPLFCGESDAAGVAFFESKVRPLLVEQCFKCHSLNQKKHKGGLEVDSLAALLKGGESGPALVPGNPEKSRIIEAVKYTNSDMQMPPKSRLSEAQVADLVQWVRIGAPWPAGAPAGTSVAQADPEKMKRMLDHWAFKKVQAQTPPKTANTAWPKSPLDSFILAKLEDGKIEPAPFADKRTLIRRATFDLTGLPPTPDEVAAFLKDESPDAFAKRVDRLLASPHYGEHWGRHWLDVARYADSNGMDENHAYGNAFRYRDYVVAALNADKPYDQFVREQIAGDLLPAEGNSAETVQRQIATGFLALGPKVLAEPDPMKMEMDIIDEQLDTLGRSFMGLTLGCARCHDHKFDPMPTADYYSLAAILKCTKTMENFKKVARWYERPLGTAQEIAAREALDKAIKAKKGEIDKFIKSSNEQVLDALHVKVGRGPVALPKKPESNYTPENTAKLRVLREEMGALEKSRVPVLEAMGATEGTISNTIRINIRGNPQVLGAEVPRRFPRVFAGENQRPIEGKISGRLQLAQWLTAPDHPLTARVMSNRIWRWHFGKGIVGSPDNFGLIGETPSHPELLDWLSTQFVENGWSIKKMHRLIMLSSTYQMSFARNEKAETVDPENRLHWRFDRRRLQAEMLRDSFLSISGALDGAIGGTVFDNKNRDYVKEEPASGGKWYDHTRRSIYIPVIRNSVYDVLQAFDFPDPNVMNGDRNSTTVAPQALFMMNGKLLLDQASKMAQSLLKRKEFDAAARVTAAYELALSRPPSQSEITRALAFVQRYSDELSKKPAQGENKTPLEVRAWQGLCQVLLASNEFVYID